LIAKVQDLLQSYSLKFKLMTDESAAVFESETARKGGGGGGLGGGKKGGMGALLGMA
jgi:uncharacterized membrane protein